ncbi:hypothetical protein QYF36_010686 [Acer negundo]|nr:hypothetical protein QYF36_010686 [Acer negundo]
MLVSRPRPLCNSCVKSKKSQGILTCETGIGTSRIHSVLQNLLVHEAELFPDSQLDAIRKKYIDKGLKTVSVTSM